jgi:hypothetical protein
VRSGPRRRGGVGAERSWQHKRQGAGGTSVREDWPATEPSLRGSFPQSRPAALFPPYKRGN